MRKWRFRLIILPFLVPLLVLVVFLVAERVRGRIALGRFKRALLAQGVKLSPQDFASGPIKEEENGAPQVAQAEKELRGGIVLPNHYPPAMRLTPAGRAIVVFREEQWRDEETTNRWEDLAVELERNEPTLARIRAALDKPLLDNQLDFSQGSRMSFKQLMAPKSLTRWFGARSQLALHDGRPHEALQELLVCLHLPRLLARDHLAISELVRIAVTAIARAQTWEAVQADGWTDPELARLQQAWQDYEFADAMVHALAGEIVFAEACYESMRQSNAEAAAVLFGMEDYLPAEAAGRWEGFLRKLPAGDALAGICKKQIYCRVWRFAWLDQDEQHHQGPLPKPLGQERCRLARPRLGQGGGELPQRSGTQLGANRLVLQRLWHPCAETHRRAQWLQTEAGNGKMPR